MNNSTLELMNNRESRHHNERHEAPHGTATTVLRPETRDPRYRNDRIETRNERARVPRRGAGLILACTHSRLAEYRDGAPVPGVPSHMGNSSIALGGDF